MTNVQVSKFRPVKNKTAASIQVTAEQILRDAYEQRDDVVKSTVWEICDQQELNEYRLSKRRDFERWLTHARSSIPTFMRYAKWEESQNDLTRARSIYERALEVTTREPSVWILYAEMEMRHKNINLARNVWDRAVVILPRVSQLWYKYIHMEEMLKNYAGVRQLYERWMEWKPEEEAWFSYIKWELRNGEKIRVREIFRQLVQTHSNTKCFVKWAKFEESMQDIPRSRSVYEAALELFAIDLERGIETTQDSEIEHQQGLLANFARFEERCGECERARTIYKFALDHLPKISARKLYKEFIEFEKKNGDRVHIEDVILNKRRFQYEDEIKLNPHNYDIWFDYINLEESTGQLTRIRDIYERAIANVPLVQEKRFWARYIFLWIGYAIFEELVAKDASRARQVYKSCLSIIPHEVFSFSKVWIMFSKFEIRQMNLDGARKIFGQALGRAPSEKIYQAYIQMEQTMLNFDRCRTIFEKWIERSPEVCKAWISYSKFEQGLGEYDRAQTLFELSIQQPELDLPELLWKTYIDYEIELKHYQKATTLYERLLERTQHVKVWISYAKFLQSIGNIKGARNIYEKAFNALHTDQTITDRVLLVETWRDFEYEVGTESTQQNVSKKMPHRVKRRRPILNEQNEETGFEEYFDYIFPDEQQMNPNLKLLETARNWDAKRKVQS